MRTKRGLSFAILAAATAAALLGPTTARAELALSIYAGKAWNMPSDVSLEGPATSFELRGVEWNDKSFTDPLYYGLRGGWWFDSHPHWGIALDYTHAKAESRSGQLATARGTLFARPVAGKLPVGVAFPTLEFSHGHNTLTLNGQYRWFPNGERDESLLGRLQPYVGAGVGVALPHVEVSNSLFDAFGTQAAGPALQGMAGFNFDVMRWASLFAEYKLSWASIEANLNPGGNLSTQLFTHQLAVGVTLQIR